MSLAAKLVLLALVALLGFAGGWKAHVGVVAKRDLSTAQETIRKSEIQTQNDNAAGLARAKQATIYRDRITEPLGRLRHEDTSSPVDCRVSPDGMRDIATLIREANASSGPAPALPASAPPGQ